ncbi:MAG: hypothetical protein ACO3EE_02995 [Flavobacteriales bacterium]
MKHVKFVILALLMCYITPTFSQSNLIWSNKFFDTASTHTNAYYNGMVVDNNADVCIVGEAYNGASNNILVAKTNSNGQTIWSVVFNGDASIQRRVRGGIGVDLQNNIYITGYQLKDIGDNNNRSDFFLMKISANGALLWTKIYDSGFNDNMDFTGIVVNPNGQVILAGMQYNSLNANYNDLLFVKFDASGDLLWDATLDGGNYETLRSVSSDANGNIYASFQTYNYTEVSLNSIGAVKLSSSGEKKWYQVFLSPNIQYLYSNLNDLSVNDKGEVFINGYMKTFDGKDFDLLTVKYDTGGKLMWYKVFDSGNVDYSAAITTDGKGNVVVSCNSFDSETGGYYCNLVKYDDGGNLVWNSKVFKSNLQGSLAWTYDMVKDDDANLFLVGFGVENGSLSAKSAQINFDGNVEWDEEFKDVENSFVFGYDIY